MPIDLAPYVIFCFMTFIHYFLLYIQILTSGFRCFISAYACFPCFILKPSIGSVHLYFSFPIVWSLCCSWSVTVHPCILSNIAVFFLRVSFFLSLFLISAKLFCTLVLVFSVVGLFAWSDSLHAH